MLRIETDGTFSGMSLFIDGRPVTGVKKISFRNVGRSDDLKIDISMASAVLKDGKPKLGTESLSYPEDIDRIMILSEFWAVQEEEEEEGQDETEEILNEEDATVEEEEEVESVA